MTGTAGFPTNPASIQAVQFSAAAVAFDTFEAAKDMVLRTRCSVCGRGLPPPFCNSPGER